MDKKLKYNDVTVSIPTELTKLSRKKALLCTLLFLVGEAIAIVAAYLFSTNSTEIATIITYCIAVSIPFFVTRFPVKLIDKTYIGEVVKVNVSTNSTAEMKNGPKSITQRTEVNVYIKEANGNILIKKASKSDNRLINMFNEFKVGDLVMHLYCTDYIFKVSTNSGMSCKCVACGTVVSGENTACGSCGMPLIKGVRNENGENQDETEE